MERWGAQGLPGQAPALPHLGLAVTARAKSEPSGVAAAVALSSSDPPDTGDRPREWPQRNHSGGYEG